MHLEKYYVYYQILIQVSGIFKQMKITGANIIFKLLYGILGRMSFEESLKYK